MERFNMDEALRLFDVTATRGRRKVLQSISLSARYGKVLAILGPNGAGKSTLLDAIAGLGPFTGEIMLEGRSLGALDRLERARRLAHVPQSSKLEAPMPVRDVVALGRFAHRDRLGRLGPSDRDAIDRALVVTDTARLADRPFTTLSFGERRRVLVARALATSARVLLLDEPTAALDIGQVLSLFELFRDLAKSGHLIVVVLHVLDEALRCADEAALLADGRLAAFGAAKEVVTREPVSRVYDVELVPEGGLGYRRTATGRR
jgi:iron complex transport system ATP-binding protein